MVKRHTHAAPSRRQQAKRTELTGDFEGFWFVLGNVKMADVLSLQASLDVKDKTNAEQMAEAGAMLRQLCDGWITDHNFVSPDDEPLPVGEGLYDAIDAFMLGAILQQAQLLGAVPNPNGGTTNPSSLVEAL